MATRVPPYAVGPAGGTVFEKRIFTSVLDIPDQSDLAVILVKADDVPRVMEEYAQKGIKRIIIQSGGFSEYREEKQILDNELIRICRKYGMRLIGPNCMGVINIHNGLFLPFGLHDPDAFRAGPVGIISQSGNVILNYSMALSFGKIGISKAASIGNKLDVDEVDILIYYLEDPQTKIIFLYLESFSRARELMELASRSTKPILIQKSNIFPLSHGIARSHTKALASDDQVVEAAFRQAGIIRVKDLDELLNCVKILLLPPLRGNRLLLMANSGGKAVMAADECQRNGLTLPALPQTLLNWIEGLGRAGIISLQNPLDLGDIHDMTVHRQVLDKLQTLSEEIDAIFYSLVYADKWDALLDYQTLFDFCSHLVSTAEIPVIIRLDPESLSFLDALRKRFSIPVFVSISETFTAYRKVLDAQKKKAQRFNFGRKDQPI